MGKESKPRHSLQFNWTNNILQARPFPGHSGFCWQFSVLAVFEPLVSTVLTVIFSFGSLASFSYLSAAAGGDGLALMKDTLRKNGPLHFCPPETFISTALRLTNTNTGQIRCTSNAPHEYKCTPLKLHFCPASFISDRKGLWEEERDSSEKADIFFLGQKADIWKTRCGRNDCVTDSLLSSDKSGQDSCQDHLVSFYLVHIILSDHMAM